MITEGDGFPCYSCEHYGDCDRGFECPKLEHYTMSKRRI